MEFRAEVQQLLNILANSLYTEREIFVRELVSNASDALHRIQFEMLTNRDVLDLDAELAIHIDFDEDAHTLTVSDTGIGMTRDELVENLGTIAHSGAMAFLRSLEEGQRPSDIIGQFGVGFYSVFMVAEEVAVTTRSYLPDARSWRWTSRGDSQFTLGSQSKGGRGTSIEIKLKDDAVEFASQWRLEQIVRKHSNYVSFPIYVKDSVINQQTALWRQPVQGIEDEEYTDFYKQLTLDFEEPLQHVHLITDAPVNIRSILYIPRRRERGPTQPRTDHGLKLYSRKVLIQEYNKELLPDYLRFVEGVVDSEDIPLNISRETVQSSRVMRQIQTALRGRVIRALGELAQERPGDYASFWNEFGPFIKEGIATNPLDHGDLLPLLRFPSSKSDGGQASLDAYVERMADGQDKIYYILGDDRASVEHSPHMDLFRSRDIEVLYLLDPLDGFMTQSLKAYADTPFQNVDDANLELPGVEDAESDAGTGIDQADFAQLIARFRQALGERVTEVRESKLLTGSPCRLVTPENEPGRDLQRVRRLLEQDFQAEPKIMELNRHHPLIENLARLVKTQPLVPTIDASIEQLFENLLLLEGLHPNPAQMVPRIQKLLEAATKAEAR